MLKYILYGLAGYGAIRIAMDVAGGKPGGSQSGIGASTKHGGTTGWSVPTHFMTSERRRNTAEWVGTSKIRHAPRIRSYTSVGTRY